MIPIEAIVLLLSLIIGLSVIAIKLKIPQPIVLVLMGLAIALMPGVPSIEIPPDLVFLLILPPVLYAAAWNTSWPDFKKARRPIFLLAFGCVLFTSTIVAWAAVHFLPGFTWPMGFLLGAIVSPPDAVSATAILSRVNAPARMKIILEGESLVNDASALVTYRYAIAAVTSGTFIFWQAGLEFLLVAGGGVAIGYALGRILVWVHNHVPAEPVINIALTIVTPLIAYLLAEEVHTSGVLATVTTGLFLSRRSNKIFTHNTRIEAYAVWETMIFLLNGIVFILIGLQLNSILKGSQEFDAWQLISYGAIISAATMGARLLWIYPGTYLPRMLSKKIRKNEPAPNPKAVLAVGWAGMRGIVSLAAALALPRLLNNGEPFPARDLILFVTFCVILATLVVQGLTLGPLMKLWKIKEDEKKLKDAELKLRLSVAYGAIEHIEANMSFGQTDEQVLAQLKNKYEIRVQNLLHRSGYSQTRLDAQSIAQYHSFQAKLLKVEREIIEQHRKNERHTEELLRNIEYELDLEESRLNLDEDNT